MTSTRLIELEMAALAHPGNRSAAMILELVEEVRRLQKRNAKRSGFVAPTEDEVAEFFSKGDVWVNGSAVEAAAEFCQHYRANGWKVGRVPMVSWKDAAGSWETRERKRRAAKMPGL